MTKYRDASTALIFSPDKVLLFHRDNIPTIPHPDCWQPVGGCLEPGETFDQALVREVYEESSFNLKDFHFLFKRPGTDNTFIAVYAVFVDKIDENKFKLGPGEGQEIGWFTLDEVATLKLTPSTHVVYVEFRSFIEEIMKTRKIDPQKLNQMLTFISSN